MSASAGCGHAVALGYVREVPKYAGRQSLAASSDAAGVRNPSHKLTSPVHLFSKSKSVGGMSSSNAALADFRLIANSNSDYWQIGGHLAPA